MTQKEIYIMGLIDTCCVGRLDEVEKMVEVGLILTEYASLCNKDLVASRDLARRLAMSKNNEVTRLTAELLDLKSIVRALELYIDEIS